MGMEAPEVGGSSQHRSWKLLSCRLLYRFCVPSSALRELFAAASDAFSTVLETFSSCFKCAVVVGSIGPVVWGALGVDATGPGNGGAPVGANANHISSDNAGFGTFTSDAVGQAQSCASI